MMSYGPYIIRSYEPTDREGVSSLYRIVHDREMNSEWFDWKFIETPYADRAPMFVAEEEGSVVGFHSYVPFPMCADGETFTGVIPTNAMVHPAHRKQGIFSKLTTYSTEYCADRYDIVFGFANEKSFTVSTSSGRTAVGPVPIYYRIQDPVQIANVFTGKSAGRVVGRLARPITQKYLAFLDRKNEADTNIEINQQKGLPAATLSSLYQKKIPEFIHIQQDKRFYNWQSKNPRWEDQTYIALENGEPVAATVARTTPRFGGAIVTTLADTVPIVRNTPYTRIFTHLLSHIITDHPTSGLFGASPLTIPPEVLREHGFFGEDSRLLSRVRPPVVLVTQNLSNLDIGKDFKNITNWGISLAVRDLN